MSAAVFIVIAIFALVAMIQTPSWIGYAIGGIVLGAISQAIYPRLRVLMRRKHARRYLLLGIGFSCLVIVFAVFSIPELHRMGDMAMKREFTASYSAAAVLNTTSNQWEIRDSVQLEIRDQDNSRDQESDETSETKELHAWLTDQMQSAGWQIDDGAAEPLTFFRMRNEAVKQQWFAPHTANDLNVPHVESLVSGIRLAPLRNGHLTLRVPYELVSRTEPEITYRSEEEAKSELVVVEFNYRNLPMREGARYVRVELMHPMFQNALLVSLRRVCDFPFVHWAIMGLCGTFNARLRERLVQPWSKRLVDWAERRIPRLHSKQQVSETANVGHLDNDEAAVGPPPDILPIDSRRYSTLFSSLRKRLPQDNSRRKAA